MLFEVLFELHEMERFGLHMVMDGMLLSKFGLVCREYSIGIGTSGVTKVSMLCRILALYV